MISKKKVHSRTKTTIIIVIIIAIIASIVLFSPLTEKNEGKFTKYVDETGTYSAVYEYTSLSLKSPIRVEASYNMDSYAVKSKELDGSEQNKLLFFYLHKQANELEGMCQGTTGEEWSCWNTEEYPQMTMDKSIEQIIKEKQSKLRGGTVLAIEGKTIAGVETKCFEQELGENKASYCFSTEGDPLYFQFEGMENEIPREITFYAMEYSLEVAEEKFSQPTGPVR